MGKISIDHVRPGMVLGSDLVLSSGRFILSKGVVLSPADLRIIMIWGIHSVDVENSCEEIKPLPEETIDPVIQKNAEEFTKMRFRQANMDHPFLQGLFHICVLRQAKQMMHLEPWDTRWCHRRTGKKRSSCIKGQWNQESLSML
jgi:hypothetical protein